MGCRPSLSRAGRLVQKEIAVAGRRFRILVDRDNDRLDMLIAPAFRRRETTNFFESLKERAGVLLVVDLSQEGATSQRPGLPLLEPVALCTEFVDLVDRSLKQRFG